MVRPEDLLSKVLYIVETRGLSLDVAFKKICRGRLCAKSLGERERIYSLARGFIASVIRLRCVHGERSRKWLARAYLEELLGRGGGVPAPEPWCAYSVPKWFYLELRDLLGEEAEDLLRSLDRRIWWVRLNTLKAPEERILRILEEEASVERDKDLWYLYKILASGKPVRLLKAVKLGLAIPQDKASCMAVEALRPEPGDLILDMAAAPGVKSSLIAMLSEGMARIVAADLSKKRGTAMKRLLKHLGAWGLVEPLLADSRLANYSRSFDKVLVDAPCSTSGVLGKEPAVRIHLLRKGSIESYSKIQKELLSKAITLGREIVFSTCSLLPDEGEEVVESLSDLAKSQDPGLPLSRGYLRYRVSTTTNRSFPHKHECEGFFISKLLPRL